MQRSRVPKVALWALIVLLAFGLTPGVATVSAEPIKYPRFADDAFKIIWERYDRPVFYGETARSYIWGNQLTDGVKENYAEGPSAQHTVQYYDKSRMEINNPSNNRNDPFYVTQGLLARDMIRGEIQEGNTQFRKTSPAEIPFGDLDDVGALSPTYASLKGVLDAPPIPSGNLIAQRIERSGNVNNSADPRGVTSVGVVPGVTTNHSIASVFYDFLQRSGPVYENGQNTTAAIFVPTFYVTGMPITEPYWATIKAAGQQRDVLIQCFERRCLTYAPTNEAAFRVELANTGLQYYAWRYPQVADKTPPQISDLVVTDVTSSGVRIVWKTSESATSEIKYGTTDQYSSLGGDLELAKFHSVTLTGLSASQNYHFIVISRDVAGNIAQTQDNVFKTRAVGASPSPSPSPSPSSTPLPTPSA